MAQQSDSEAYKMLDAYILDYFRKRNLHASANTFVTEAMVAEDPVEFHAPAGFLSEWWSVFLDIYSVMQNHPCSEGAAAYIKAQQMKAQALGQQRQKMQQWQQHAQLQQRDANHHSLHDPANHPSLHDPTNAIISGLMLGQPTSSDLEAKAYESYMNPHQLMETAPSQHLLAANRIVQPISAINYLGQMVQGNLGDGSAAFQQIQSWTQQNTAQQMKAQALEQQGQKMPQWQQNAQLQQRDANHPSLRDPTNAIISGVMLGQPTSSDLEAKAYESYMNPLQLMETAPSQHLLVANRIVQPILAVNYPGQIVQGNLGDGFAAFQQIHSWTQQNMGIEVDANLGVTQRSLPVDHSIIYGQGICSQSLDLMKMDQMQQVSANQQWDQMPKSQLTQNDGKRENFSSPGA